MTGFVVQGHIKVVRADTIMKMYQSKQRYVTCSPQF